jgi:hypothetical protein
MTFKAGRKNECAQRQARARRRKILARFKREPIFLNFPSKKLVKRFQTTSALIWPKAEKFWLFKGTLFDAKA